MTKKHFIALGNFIKNDQRLQSPAVIEALADYLETVNPRFLRNRFIGFVEGRNGPNGGSL